MGTATTGYEDLKNIAVGRLFLDNVPHIKTHWPMVTPFLSQIALQLRLRRRRGHGGVRADLPRGRRAHPDAHALPRARAASSAGRGSGRSSATASISRCARSSTTRRRSRRSAGARRCRWCTPHEARPDSVDQLLSGLRRDRSGPGARAGGAGDRHRVRAERSARRGRAEVSVVSAVEYARNAAAYHLLPDLAITCDGPVHSVALFSRRPVAELDGCTVLRTASSRTSVLLLELIARHRWNVRPRYATARAEAADLDALVGPAARGGARHRRRGAPARARRSAIRCRVDLGAEWKAWTGLPFVFAVWAARRDAGLEAVQAVHRRLLESRAWGLAHLDELAAAAARTHRCGGAGLPRVSRRPGLRAVVPAPGRAHRLLPAAGAGGAGAGRVAVVHLGGVAAVIPSGARDLPGCSSDRARSLASLGMTTRRPYDQTT